MNAANKEDENRIVREALDRSLTDEAFRKEFIKNPRGVLERAGVVYPAHLNVIVIELPDNTIGITIPPMISKA
jgi:hypothetical protein